MLPKSEILLILVIMKIIMGFCHFVTISEITEYLSPNTKEFE